MRLLFLTNNQNSHVLAEWLVELGEDVICLQEPMTLHTVAKLHPDLIISYNYSFIIARDIITYMDGNIINLHISYLPFNRGSSPNIWSILEHTPKGVTIHYIDADLDTGDIIAQRQIDIPNSVTLKESYDRLQQEIQSLFKEIYPLRSKWRQMSYPQRGVGSKHSQKDFNNRVADLIYSWDMTGEQLLQLYKEKYDM